MHFKEIKGIIFDMDGTLVDSEINTERSVRKLLKKHGLNGDNIDYSAFHGITWKAIEAHLVKLFPQLKDVKGAEELESIFHTLFVEENPPFIEGADSFFLQCCRSLPTAIATSSNREDLDYLIRRIGAEKTITAAISAEDYEKSKPDPECYLLAAKRIGCSPRECIVFEDSIAGLTAGRNAGMHTIAIMKHRDVESEVEGIAEMKIKNYLDLPADFLTKIQQENEG